MRLENHEVVTLLIAEFDVLPAAIRAEATWEELGLDSLAQVEFRERLCEVSRTEITEDEFADSATVTGLVGLIDRKRAAAP
ncbi:acyl carrier protein [Kutzneria sp. NPDC052558]|uniref:acyl carrier protein n=1 Tax=Kutzneria sp. NPDC052558 TaxID=3364121 RepID=UPI0037C81BED